MSSNLENNPNCPTCGGRMAYTPSVGHDTPPEHAMEPYYYCPNRKCAQPDLDSYPPHEPLRTRGGRYVS